MEAREKSKAAHVARVLDVTDQRVEVLPEPHPQDTPVVIRPHRGSWLRSSTLLATHAATHGLPPSATPECSYVCQGNVHIAHALLGKIDAAEKSSNELAQHVTALLRDGYILKPAVSVSLIDQKPYQIRIIGEVTKPGEIVYPRDKTMDLGSAIGLVGNMTEDADETAITLKRDEKVTNVRVSELSSTILQDGDIVSIGKLAELGTFSISGEVVKAGTYIIPREKEGKLTIFAAISLAGGPTKVAKLSKTIVTRANDSGNSRSITVDAADRSKVFYVRPGDEIEVKARLF